MQLKLGYTGKDIRRLEAFEMWVWRRMEKVSWRDMKTNEEVLQLVQEKKKPNGCDMEEEEKLDRSYTQGPSIKYVTLFLANFDPLPLSLFVTHPGTLQKYVTHLGPPPPIFSRPSQKNPDKSPLYKFSLNRAFVRGLLSGVFCLEGFVWGGFCPYPLLSEYICYNRKLKITLNFMFHM